MLGNKSVRGVDSGILEGAQLFLSSDIRALTAELRVKFLESSWM